MLWRNILAASLCALPLPALAAYGGPGVTAGGTAVNYGDLLFCTVVTTAPTYTAGQTQACSQDAGGDLRVVELNNLATSAAPGTSSTKAQGVQGVMGGVPIRISNAGSNAATDGITPTVSTGTSQVAKNAQGNLYSAKALNTTTTVGYLVCINATAAPAASAAITPVDYEFLAGTVGAEAKVDYSPGPPDAYSTGITCLISTSLTTFTAGGSAVISTRVR